MRRSLSASLVLFVCLASAANAHVEFKQSEIDKGKATKVTLVVGHGCGKSPTVKLRVKTPSGVMIKSAPEKSGWAVDKVAGSSDETFTFHGEKASQAVDELVWTGKLDAHDHGKFMFELELADQLEPGQKIYFPVVQECEKGVLRWIDQEASDDDAPAPFITVGAGS